MRKKPAGTAAGINSKEGNAMAGGPKQEQMLQVVAARAKCTCKSCEYCCVRGIDLFGCGGCFEPKENIAACQECPARLAAIRLL